MVILLDQQRCKKKLLSKDPQFNIDTIETPSTSWECHHCLRARTLEAFLHKCLYWNCDEVDIAENNISSLLPYLDVRGLKIVPGIFKGPSARGNKDIKKKKSISIGCGEQVFTVQKHEFSELRKMRLQALRFQEKEPISEVWGMC